MRIPVLRDIAKAVNFAVASLFKPFSGSEDYWKKRYKSGGNSGPGSYHKLAEFKAEILNEFVRDRQIKTVIEYGCGDGNQLTLARYPLYVGFDVSPDAILQCKENFSGDKTKTFKLVNEYDGETAQLTLSLDVIYHLIEDDVYYVYMDRLFKSATNFVIIYSSNTDQQERFQLAHVKHRKFSNWIHQNKPHWELIEHIPAKYAHVGNEQAGFTADFFIYEKRHD